MDIETIKSIFNDKKSKPIDIDRRYAILLPLVYIDEEIHILYQVRSQNLDTQPGEISFPGGSVEPFEVYKEAAIRETCEELNIKKENIDIIGELDYILSPYNMIIRGYIGALKNLDINKINYNKEEVDHIFFVPLDFFLNNEPKVYNSQIDIALPEDFPFQLIPNGKKYKWRQGNYPILFYQHEQYIIWGMTARLTYNFIKSLIQN